MTLVDNKRRNIHLAHFRVFITGIEQIFLGAQNSCLSVHFHKRMETSLQIVKRHMSENVYKSVSHHLSDALHALLVCFSFEVCTLLHGSRRWNRSLITFTKSLHIFDSNLDFHAFMSCDFVKIFAICCLLDSQVVCIQHRQVKVTLKYFIKVQETRVCPST